jgi:hypothetical protein
VKIGHLEPHPVVMRHASDDDMTVSDFLSGWAEADGNSFDDAPDAGEQI